MKLQIGIVGLPNVGKSTLFQALTRLEVPTANYPFTTINPNIGVINVVDNRFRTLVKAHKPKKATPATVRFVDIAGLIPGASQGAGLGNAFLANIRMTHVIAHVVRCFTKKEVEHVLKHNDPVQDIEAINLELFLADQQQLTKMITKNKKRIQNTGSKQEKQELNFMQEVLALLKDNVWLRKKAWSKEQQAWLETWNLLTFKKVIIVANINEQDIANPLINPLYQALDTYCKQKELLLTPLAIDYEATMLALEQEASGAAEEQTYAFPQGGQLEAFINQCYYLLGLAVFYTVGPQEVRAWNFVKGWNAALCAGQIHTDFQKRFVRAEVYHYQDLELYPTEKELKEHGKIRLEGKNYLMQDGDICFFRIA